MTICYGVSSKSAACVCICLMFPMFVFFSAQSATQNNEKTGRKLGNQVTLNKEKTGRKLGNQVTQNNEITDRKLELKTTRKLAESSATR